MESSGCKASESGWMRLAAVTLLGAVLGPAAHAEDSRERQQNAVLEEVVVTAERRSENLQDVPISITALTREDLRDLHIQSTTDLGAQVPNLDVRPTGSGENTYVGITIRGVSSTGLTYAAGQPVLVYSDDQLLESILSHGMAFFDMEGVEVLRGPQGTLFGRNTTAGAMSVRSARPGSELNGYAELSYGEWDQTRVEGAVGGPVSDTIGLRIAGFLDTKDGWVDNIHTGDTQLESETYGVRAILEFAPTENLDVFLKAQASRVRQDPFVQASTLPPPHIFSGFGLDDALLYNPGPESNYTKVNTNFRSGQLLDDVDDDQFNLSINWDIGNMVLTSVTGYVTADWDYLDDYDASAAVLQHIRTVVSYEGFTQEVRLASETQSPFQWIVGGFYLYAETFDSNANDFTDTYALFGFPAPPGLGFGSANTNSTDTKSWAAFAHTTFAWSDRVTTTHALRYTRDKQDRVRSASDFTIFPNTSLTSYASYSFHIDASGAPFVDHKNGASWDEVTWRLAVDYAVTDDMLWYGSVSTGYKAGLVSNLFDGTLGEFPTVEPETVLAYETGIKSRWLEDRLQLNAAIFYYDYEDYQSFAQVITPSLQVQTIDINIPQVDLTGLEIEVVTQPIDNLMISIGYGYVDNEIAKYVNDASEDLTGNNVSNAPRHGFNGYIRYDFLVGGTGSISPQIDWSYKGKYYYTNENPAQFGEFWTANVRLEYRNERIGISAFVENVSDKTRGVGGYPEYIGQLGTDFSVRSYPRTWGITLRTLF